MSAALIYRRVGGSTYEVSEAGQLLGLVWRTRRGWSASLPDGTVAVDNYPGSRAVAAGNLRRELDSPAAADALSFDEVEAAGLDGTLRTLDACPTGQHEVDELADEPDRCVKCDELVCPDCGRTVDYFPEGPVSYAHRDGGACFLHGSDR